MSETNNKVILEDDNGKYTIITKSRWWSHGCHPETCGCGNKVINIIDRYKQYENGELIKIS